MELEEGSPWTASDYRLYVGPNGVQRNTGSRVACRALGGREEATIHLGFVAVGETLLRICWSLDVRCPPFGRKEVDVCGGTSRRWRKTGRKRAEVRHGVDSWWDC